MSLPSARSEGRSEPPGPARSEGRSEPPGPARSEGRSGLVDDVAVAIHDLGGDGPPLLFAHATGFHGLVWKPVADRLADTFHCWSFDERGHGDTAAPADGNFAWEGFARDALAVVDALGLQRPYGVGHSGGGAALLLAEQMRPTTFTALFGYDPVVMAPTVVAMRAAGGPNPLASGARKRREVFPSKDAAFENYAGKPPLGVFDRDALRAYVDHGFFELDDGTVRLKCRGEVEARVYEMASEHGAWAGLPEIRCPVTFACGAETDAFGPESMAAQADRVQGSRVEVLPGLGHFGPMQGPDAVAAAIRRAFAPA